MSISPEDKTKIRRIYESTDLKIIAATPGQLYTALSEARQYSDAQISGVVVFTKDKRTGVFQLQIVDVSRGVGIAFDCEVHEGFRYEKEGPSFHTFQTKVDKKNGLLAFSFSHEHEAEAFYSRVVNRGSGFPEPTLLSLATASKTALATPRNKKTPGLDKSRISAPSNFQHLSHIGWDEGKGFSVENIPAYWGQLFSHAGDGKDDQTKSPAVSDRVQSGTVTSSRLSGPPPSRHGEHTTQRGPPPAPPPRSRPQSSDAPTRRRDPPPPHLRVLPQQLRAPLSSPFPSLTQSVRKRPPPPPPPSSRERILLTPPPSPPFGSPAPYDSRTPTVPILDSRDPTSRPSLPQRPSLTAHHPQRPNSVTSTREIFHKPDLMPVMRESRGSGSPTSPVYSSPRGSMESVRSTSSTLARPLNGTTTAEFLASPSSSPLTVHTHVQRMSIDGQTSTQFRPKAPPLRPPPAPLRRTSNSASLSDDSNPSTLVPSTGSPRRFPPPSPMPDDPSSPIQLARSSPRPLPSTPALSTHSPYVPPVTAGGVVAGPSVEGRSSDVTRARVSGHPALLTRPNVPAPPPPSSNRSFQDRIHAKRSNQRNTTSDLPVVNMDKPVEDGVNNNGKEDVAIESTMDQLSVDETSRAFDATPTNVEQQLDALAVKEPWTDFVGEMGVTIASSSSFSPPPPPPPPPPLHRMSSPFPIPTPALVYEVSSESTSASRRPSSMSVAEELPGRENLLESIRNTSVKSLRPVDSPLYSTTASSFGKSNSLASALATAMAARSKAIGDSDDEADKDDEWDD